MKRFIEDTANSEEFDVIIIGGGISGAAVARETSAAGLKTVLLEKKDFGWATSAATSKLIHGGLRYLKNLEFGLVRESLRERRILEDIAPNFVYPIPFLVPHYDLTSKWMLAAGLTLYDLLAFDRGWTRHRKKRIAGHKALSARALRELAPVIPVRNLVGGSLYYDCQSIFPERLTLAFIKSAQADGASVANYTEVVGFLREGSRITGVRVRDRLSDRRFEVRGRVVLNSAGPWAEEMLELGVKKSGVASENVTESHLRMSEGIHIIVPRLVKDHSLVLLTKGGRHFFILPWRNHSLIGTTDKAYEGDPDDYRVTRKSIEEFVDEINGTLETANIRYEDIVFAYGGLRPLTDTQTENTYTSSRKYEIFDSAKQGVQGLITVEGGKYTTSRNLARHALKKISAKLPKHISNARGRSRKTYLYGCEIEDVDRFIEDLKQNHPHVSNETLEYLGRNYGTETEAVLAIAREDPQLAEPRNPDGEIFAEVAYAIRREMARTLEDVLFRRTGFGTLGLPDDQTLRDIADLAAQELNWSAKRVETEIQSVRARFALPQ